MSSHFLSNPTPSSDDATGAHSTAPDLVDASKLPPLSQEAQANLWRYIDHLERWRQSIGFEIHDGLTQQITAALLFLESYEKEKPDTTSLDRCRAILEEALAESRRLIQGLNPKRLDEEGIEAALLDFIKLPSLSAAQIDVKVDKDLPRLAPWQRSCLFRFFQESITNARKHSEAQAINVSLTRQGQDLVACVKDDGLGFDVESIELTSHGLIGLKQKADLLEGKLTIDSALERGTKIELRIPSDAIND
ncbi:sensor histidine kinase [Bremerella sp. P1]|uniref:sensor histidine kinase n=1 Tax=Bremerella sp. P1 TaxID=3026424 RepID=UPI00236849EE|nr:sensor histidine kinase [Bremerella sp. P1]WDI44723.1 sensor histidine kinase [Bremerella sp. P1]